MSFALPEHFQPAPDEWSGRGTRGARSARAAAEAARVLAGQSPSRLARLVMRPPEGAWTAADQDAFDVAVGLLALASAAVAAVLALAGLLVAAVI